MPGASVHQSRFSGASPAPIRIGLPSFPAPRRSRYPLGVGALAASYYAVAHVGFAFHFTGPVAAIVWLPVGVGIGFLYIAGLRFWPGVALGDLLVNNYSALPIGSAVAQSVGNVLEVVVATALLRRLYSRSSPLDEPSGLLSILIAISAGTALSATIGALSLLLGHVITASSVPHVWRTWWFGDFSGALIVLPVILAWRSRPPPDFVRGRGVEALVLVLAIVGLNEVEILSGHPFSYLVFPALIWAAWRFGPRGATMAILITAGFAIWGTTDHDGPFTTDSTGVFDTQLFIFAVALSALSIACVVSERDELASRLRASRGRLVEAGDAARRRLERDLHDGAQQRLVALAAHLGIDAQRAREAPADSTDVLESAQSEVLLAIDQLRALAHGIHPAVLVDFGLVRALERVRAGSTLPIALSLPAERLDAASESTAYYVILEGITNAQKHSYASWVRVHATLTAGALEIEVLDNGVGGADERRGMGLEGLRDRVEAIGGRFELDSPLHRGTRLAATIPATPARSSE
jgi:signal transduction histidine kinase